MHLRHLSLLDFRNYPEVELPLSAGTTAFVGPNGHGKTNLVEAVGYLATQSSHRVSTDAPLVRAGAQHAIIRGSVHRHGRDTTLELDLVPGRANRARLNRSPVRPRELLGVLRTVLFAPEDLALVKGDPAGRRAFLDTLLVQLAPRFSGVLVDYDRVLKQRNTLLKQALGERRGRRRAAPPPEAGATVEATLDVWDAQLARFGADLLAARLYLIAQLAPHTAQAYRAVSGGAGDAVLGYRSTIGEQLPGLDQALSAGTDLPSRDQLTQTLTQALLAARPAERERGQTLVGPHRDDLVLTLGGLAAKGYASHGESWSYALALRLGGYALLRVDEDPVLILDDVFAELDAGRRARLAAEISGADQVLITAAVEEDIPDGLVGHRVLVDSGRVVDQARSAQEESEQVDAGQDQPDGADDAVG